jgi:hypothetical protein
MGTLVDPIISMLLSQKIEELCRVEHEKYNDGDEQRCF